MQKMVKWLIIIFIGVAIFLFVKDKQQAKQDDKIAKDNQKIEQVIAATDKLVYSKALLSLGNANAWNAFDIRVINQDGRDFFVEMKKILGDDFDGKLSTGEYIFVSVLPMYQKFQVYAGEPLQDKSNMLYPDWNYDKIQKSTVVK